MVDYNKIKKWNESIKKNQAKLKLETNFLTKQKVRYQIDILSLRIKVERLN